MGTVHYKPEFWIALRQAFSDGRLSYYEKLANGSRERAFDLHQWNTRLCETLHTPLQAFEIVLRNTIDAKLTQSYGRRDWYADTKWLRRWCDDEECAQKTEDDIQAAIRSARKDGPLSHDNFIAATSLGLWVRFLDDGYSRLWEQVLRAAFSGAPERKRLWRNADLARRVRNRVAHYQPVVGKERGADMSLDKLRAAIIESIRLVSPAIADWVAVSSASFCHAWTARPQWWNPDRKLGSYICAHK